MWGTTGCSLRLEQEEKLRRLTDRDLISTTIMVMTSFLHPVQLGLDIIDWLTSSFTPSTEDYDDTSPTRIDIFPSWIPKKINYIDKSCFRREVRRVAVALNRYTTCVTRTNRPCPRTENSRRREDLAERPPQSHPDLSQYLNQTVSEGQTHVETVSYPMIMTILNVDVNSISRHA